MCVAFYSMYISFNSITSVVFSLAWGCVKKMGCVAERKCSVRVFPRVILLDLLDSPTSVKLIQKDLSMYYLVLDLPNGNLRNSVNTRTFGRF